MTIHENRANVAYISKSAKTGVDDVFAESRDITIAVLKPCLPNRPETCGLVPAAEQTVRYVGTLAAQGATTVQQSGTLVVTAAQNMDTASNSIADLETHLATAIDDFGGTAKSATKLIDTGTDYFQKKKPQFDLLLTHFNDFTVSGNGSVTRFNALMDSQNTARTSQGIADLMVNSARFMLTADQVEEKLAKCTLHPTIGCVAKSYGITAAQLFGYASPGIPK